VLSVRQAGTLRRGLPGEDVEQDGNKDDYKHRQSKDDKYRSRRDHKHKNKHKDERRSSKKDG
jgi:hypothetical protein